MLKIDSTKFSRMKVCTLGNEGIDRRPAVHVGVRIIGSKIIMRCRLLHYIIQIFAVGACSSFSSNRACHY